MADQGELIRLDMFYGMPGASTMMNVFHFKLDSSVPDADLLTDLEAWTVDEWVPAWEPMASLNASILSIAAKIVAADGTVLRDIGLAVINRQGDSLDSATSAGVSAMIQVPTRVPKVRGRKYIPGLSEGNISGALFNAGALADLATLAIVFYTIYVGDLGAVLRPAVLSKLTGAAVDLLYAAEFDDVPDYQRRRRPDRGS